MSEERLQKILAHAGVASRRAAEAIITAGRVRVNGKVVTELGAKADPRKDKVELDGARLVAETPVYLVLHKPRGAVSTMSDPEGRLTIKDFLKGVSARVYPVGRLDYATSGVLLVTNDGEFSDGLLHPKREVPKTYVVKVSGTMALEDLQLWSKGVELDDGPTKAAKVTLLRFEGDKTWIELTIKEGRNQQVRRMGEATGFPVMRLVRASFAGISSDNLKPGAWRHLTRDELTTAYGVPKSLPAPPAEVEAPRGVRGRVAGVDARGRARGKPAERAQPGVGRTETRAPRTDARTPREDSRGERVNTHARRGETREPRAESRSGRGDTHARRNDTRAPRGGSRTPAMESPTPRYGGGSPGRRGYEVKEDWGGGSGRGSSGSRDSSSADRAAPGGRGRATRTTGTGGGVGASSDGAGYRMERGRKR
jgi:23S rRNA pseudouridine2605 synthase